MDTPFGFSGRAGARARMFGALASLTRAGLPVRSAAALLERGGRSQAGQAAARALESGLEQGLTIAQSLAPVLSPLEAAVVAPAEKSGRLAEGFAHLESWHQVRQRTAARFTSAALYPLVLLHGAAVLPAVVGAVMAGGHPLAAGLGALVTLWGGLALAAALAFVWLRQAGRSAAAEQLLWRVPVAGPAVRRLALSRWLTVLHFQISAGLKISGGLRAAGAASGSLQLDKASLSAAQDVERDGITLGEALMARKVFPEELSGSLAMGESAGTLDLETLRLAQMEELESAAAAERAARLAGTVIYVLAALFAVRQIFRIAGMYGGMMQRFMDSL